MEPPSSCGRTGICCSLRRSNFHANSLQPPPPLTVGLQLQRHVRPNAETGCTPLDLRHVHKNVCFGAGSRDHAEEAKSPVRFPAVANCGVALVCVPATVRPVVPVPRRVMLSISISTSSRISSCCCYCTCSSTSPSAIGARPRRSSPAAGSRDLSAGPRSPPLLLGRGATSLACFIRKIPPHGRVVAEGLNMAPRSRSFS